MAAELPELVVADGVAWRRWLAAHHADPTGVWLVLAKGRAETPTALKYDAALEEALCYGWIDGQVQRRDVASYRQRFTPRRPRSAWSKRNVTLAEGLMAEGRMEPAGLRQVEQARTDGRWSVAYLGAATIEVPPDLATALAANPQAQAMFEILTSQNRYAVLYRIGTAKRAETRTRRVETFVAMLSRGETVYPQSRSLDER